MLINKIKIVIQNNVSKLRSKLFPLVPHNDLFPHQVIVHFSYHKCLTSYYNRIMNVLSREFNFYYKHYQSDVQAFEKTLLGSQKKCAVSVNNRSDISFETFPPYKGSHFIRDPRDLIVSGYRYHLWCAESWCKDPNFDWARITAHPYFLKHVADGQKDMPKHISYQDYLNTLDSERGMIVELIWRQPHFAQMLNWKFDNRLITEHRYEEIIGKEVDCFEQIFLHYGFHPKIMNRGLQLVEEYALKNQPKGKSRHTRHGLPNQWMSEFTPLHKELFKALNGKLLLYLNYENDTEW